MKIKINEFWLCSSGQLAPNSLRINGRRQVQVAPILRAAASQVWDRGNTITQISFSVVREHNNVKEAEAYMLQHEVEIPTAGTVTFVCHDENDVEALFYLDSASLETTEAIQIGVSTEHSYQITGGRITTQKPAETAS